LRSILFEYEIIIYIYSLRKIFPFLKNFIYIHALLTAEKHASFNDSKYVCTYLKIKKQYY